MKFEKTSDKSQIISNWKKTIFLIASLIFILYQTLLTRDIGTIRIFKGPFWELKSGMWHDIVLNIALFIPFGFAGGSFWRGKSILYGMLISTGIEIIQFIGALGYTEVDDVINNTIGACLGVLIWVLFEKLLRGE